MYELYSSNLIFYRTNTSFVSWNRICLRKCFLMRYWFSETIWSYLLVSTVFHSFIIVDNQLIYAAIGQSFQLHCLTHCNVLFGTLCLVAFFKIVLWLLARTMASCGIRDFSCVCLSPKSRTLRSFTLIF